MQMGAFLLFSISTIILLLLPLGGASAAQTSFRPTALILPVRKDPSTHQYLTRITQRTPLVPLTLAVDLGAKFMWVNCDRDYASSTYKPVHCRTATCSSFGSNSCGSCNGPPSPGCNNNTCGSFPDNPFVSLGTIGELAEDVVSLASTDGSNPTRRLAVVRNFVFVCGSDILIPGLAKGARGLIGLSRSPIALPLQFSRAFSFPRKFAVCLPSSSRGEGVIFFGNSPYNLLPDIEVSRRLTYTPLYINPVSTASAYVRGEKSVEYFIGVKSIKVGERPLRINTTLLRIDSNGNGGTKISTVDRFTRLQTSIYREFSSAFIREAAARNISRIVPGIAPFDLCFSTANVLSTRTGPSVPYISLGLDGQNAPTWTITGSNSMVAVDGKALCLGFVDGGENPRTAIVIGASQLEDNLVQFDLASSRLGFSSSLLGYRTTCSNFNFTAIP